MFDPFDEANRDKRPRRKREDVQAEKRNWHKKIDDLFILALNDNNNPDYVKGYTLLEDALFRTDAYDLLKRNITASLLRLNYEKMPAKTSDGRWKIDGINTFVYKKIGMPDLDLSQLKEYFG